MREMASELELGRARALEAERAATLRESARQVAHELKNPLTPIRFAVDRLRRDADRIPPELAETIEVLAIESARLEEMARSFAQFGRLHRRPLDEGGHQHDRVLEVGEHRGRDADARRQRVRLALPRPVGPEQLGVVAR